MKTKYCCRCDSQKPATSNFWHKSNTTKDGWQGWCKECRSVYSRERNYEVLRKERRDWKEEYQRSKSRPSYAKQQRKWITKNADYIKWKGKQTREKNKQELVYRMANQSAQKRGAKGKLKKAHWVAVLMIAEYKCLSCERQFTKKDKDILTIDHVIPLIKGGTNTTENIQPLCWRCNMKKGHKDGLDFRPKGFVRKVKKESERRLGERRAWSNPKDEQGRAISVPEAWRKEAQKP